MTPARLEFIQRMRAVAGFLDSGTEVQLSLKAGDLAILLRLAAEAAVFEAAVEAEDGVVSDVVGAELRALLKQAHFKVLPAVEK